MSLIGLWHTSRTFITDKRVQQILGFAGDGNLIDGNKTSQEFREFLTAISSEMLDKYANDCLVAKFEQSGFVLQDLVNEIGRRLAFDVTHGLYRGRKGSIGYDGIWHSLADPHDIVIEVKTTDTYRISLDDLVKRRNALTSQRIISEKPNSSILIVVGREDTGGLEAQIRGSNYAHEIRIVSIEALTRLLKVKEAVENVGIDRKICAVLKPQEFTKVDGIIDLVFSTTEDLNETKSKSISGADNVPETDVESSEDNIVGKTSKPVAFNEECMLRISEYIGIPLAKQSRTTYRSSDGHLVISCAVSKKYQRARPYYWFAFHPTQQERLEEAIESFAAFGCGSEDTIFLIPFKEFKTWLDDLNQTIDEDRNYWHVQIVEYDGKWEMLRKGRQSGVNITDYLLR